MDVSPYLMRRLRSLEEFLETKGTSAALWQREAGQARDVEARPRRAAIAGGTKAERARLVLVSSNDRAASVDGGGG